MIYYSQSTGTWTDDKGAVLLEGCYAGRDADNPMPGILEYRGKNNPAAQEIHDVGPLPVGTYTISPVHTIPHLGLSMALTPAPTNQMFGRSGFFVHLDNPAHVGESSDGCIVAPSLGGLMTIEQKRQDGETQVTVTA